jgi:hypothetical protein
MFILEHFMKRLKDFVRQNAQLEGSMSEGWLIQEGLIFITQYLHEADSSLAHPFSIRHSMSVMDLKVQDGPTIVPQGMGRSLSLTWELQSKLNNFCILNMQVMRAWVDKYNEACLSIRRERAHIRHEHG